MPTKSDVYRVLIASPSDLTEERQAATEVVNEWNAQHAAAESVVLLPVKWETHAMPEGGVRPQQAINDQLVRSSDILIGMFWTKLGTNTGVADSGTVEEIEQFVSDGKPTMLYFSSRPIDPNKLDLKQLKKLRSFKDDTCEKALAGSFKDVPELQQILLRDLVRRVRDLKATVRSRVDNTAAENLIRNPVNRVQQHDLEDRAGHLQAYSITGNAYAAISLGPEVEEQTGLRAAALFKFAFSWLLLDQLPGGGWGRSLAPWMRANWYGAPIAPDSLIEDEGGLESSVLAFRLYFHTYFAHQRTGYSDRILERFTDYLLRQHDPVTGAFGTRSLKQEGITLTVTLRHTALACYAFMLLNQCQRGTHDLELSRALQYLFGRTAEEYADDRNGCLLYVLINCIVEQLQGKNCLISMPELDANLHKWKTIHEPRMRRLFMHDQYEPIPKTEQQVVHSYPFLIPYGRFYRMTTYTFLVASSFISPVFPEEVRHRVRDGLNRLLTDYLRTCATNRNVTGDPLRPSVRGVPSWQTSESPDLGCTALLLAAVMNENVRRSVWSDGALPIDFAEVPRLLSQDLIDLFDRYLIEPQLFRYTHAVALGHVLLVPGIVPQNGTKSLDLLRHQIERMRFEQGLSEFSLNELVETELFRKSDQLPTHVFARSLSRLLLDRVRPGRYAEGEFSREKISQTSIVDKLVDDTLQVYRNEFFVQKFTSIWGKAPITEVAAAFLRLCKERHCSALLDVGSGPGQNAKVFQDAGLDVTILDASEPMMRAACSVLNRQTSDPRCIQADMRDLRSLKTRTYDAIWLSGSLIHFPERVAQEIVTNLVKLLSKRGVFMVNCAIDNPRLVAIDKRFFAYWRSRDDFVRLLTTAGLQVENVFTNYVRTNTYQESGLNIRWDNFICTVPAEQSVQGHSELTSIAYDLIVRRFFQEHVSDASEAKLLHLLKLIGDRRGRVLDAGCGPGHLTHLFASRGFEAIGLDLSPRMIELASSKYPDCQFRIGDFCDLQFPDQSFLAVFCMAAFQHVPKDRDIAKRAIEGFYRVLEPQGVILLNVQLGRATGWEPDGRFTQGYRHQDEVISMLRDAGFAIVEADQWKLPPGHNSFKRRIDLNFCDLIATKV